MPVDALLGGFAQVVPEMSPVGDLECLRGAAGGVFGIEGPAVAADDLDVRPLGEPGRQRVCFTVRLEVDRATIDEHSSVDSALALGVVVHADHAGCRRGRIRQRGDQPQQGVALTGVPKTSVIRVPARPVSARPTETYVDRSRSVRRPNRRVSPGTCSAKVLRGQEFSAQTNRRTRKDTTTNLPTAGRSWGNFR